MILSELVSGEQDPNYQALEVSNGKRHYDFLHSIVAASLGVGRPFLSAGVIKALNYHAIACLHVNAGDYRPWLVKVGDYDPPEHYRVQALMDDMVNQVNRNWDQTDGVVLATFVLWRMNWIHPFINGNGRTARAACYFVLCVKAGGWLVGNTILPELIRRERNAYVVALKEVDKSFMAGNLDLKPLHELVAKLLQEQIGGAGGQPQPQPEPQAELQPQPEPTAQPIEQSATLITLLRAGLKRLKKWLTDR